MRKNIYKAIAAVSMAATIVASLSCASCQGRKMSNMVPKGETVEVVIEDADTIVPPASPDSAEL